MPSCSRNVHPYNTPLKALDTFGNCQRPVFSLGVSQHMHKISNLWKVGLNWSTKSQEKKEKHPCFLMPEKDFSLKSFSDLNIGVRNHLFLKKLHYFRGCCFSQCLLSTAFRDSLPRKFVMLYSEFCYHTCPGVDFTKRYIWLVLSRVRTSYPS